MTTRADPEQSDREPVASIDPTTDRVGWIRRNLAVIGGTLTLLSVCIGFLLHTPTLIGPDESFQLDRVVAAAHGDLGVVPGALHRSAGVRRAEAIYKKASMSRGGSSWAEFDSSPRDLRPSLAELGGNVRPTSDATNYMAQHPPLYYGVMGVLMWLMPNADGIPVDQLVFWLRLFNVLMILPLPWLFHRTARLVLGGLPDLGAIRTAAINAAPFAPLLLPGLSRFAATINNDNLGNLLGAGIIYGSIRVLRGDTGRRTAALLAGLTVLASLTKLTVLVVAVAVPVAYLIRWVLDRRRPSTPVLGILLAGAVGSVLWGLRNKIAYGQVIPSDLAWGSRRRLVEGVLRPPDKPFSFDTFWERVGPNIQTRFWGALGLQEPPQFPTLMLWLLTAALVGSVVVCLVVLRGRRLAVLLPWLLGVGILLVVLGRSLVHYISYTALNGVQGRYVYPAAIGLLLPMAIGAAIWLGRARRWAPVVVAVGGLVAGFWALFLSFEYTWLHRGEHLTLSTLDFALRTFARHFAFPTAPTAIFAALTLLCAAAGLACAVALAVADRSGRDRTLTSGNPGPVTCPVESSKGGPPGDPAPVPSGWTSPDDQPATTVISPVPAADHSARTQRRGDPGRR